MSRLEIKTWRNTPKFEQMAQRKGKRSTSRKAVPWIASSKSSDQKLVKWQCLHLVKQWFNKLFHLQTTVGNWCTNYTPNYTLYFKLLLIWKFDPDFLTRFSPLCSDQDQGGISGRAALTLELFDRTERVCSTIAKSLKSYKWEGSNRSASLRPNEVWRKMYVK